MELCKLLISKSHTIISVVDEKGTIKFASDALVGVLGYHPDDRKGVNVFDYVHPDDVAEAKRVFEELLQKEEGMCKCQYRHRHADGSWRWLEVTGQNYLSHPEVNGVIVNARDISDIKNAEALAKETDQSLQAILENLPMAVFAHNLDGDVLYVNDHTARYTGYSKDELLKMSISDIDNDVVTRKDREKIWDTLKPGQKETFRVVHVRKEGTKYPAEISLSPVMINNEQILLAVAVDITDRIKSEKALQKSKEKYRKLNAAKDKFFKIISHDLRGPVGSVYKLSELLNQRFDKFTPEELKSLIVRLSDSSKSTMNLLDDLLCWSRAQSGNIEHRPETIAIHDFVNCNFNLVREQAETKGISLVNEIDGELEMFADRQAMNTVMRNLLTNAIKFSRIGGEVNVIARELKHADHTYVQLEVKDQGIGMDKVKADSLFSIEHAESTPGTDNEHGTGLGLIVCKEFVAHNQGKMSVQSAPDRGTSFFVNIPT